MIREISNRYRDVHPKLQQAASRLSPEDIVEHGRWLGAGVAGGSYEVEVDGQTYVAKQWGHPQSELGGLGIWSDRYTAVQAAKQVAVQNALAMAGFPAPVSVLLAPESRWLLMEKVPGVDSKELDQGEFQRAIALTDALSKEITPVVQQTLQDLAPQYPDQPDLFFCAIDIRRNAHFYRTPDGLVLAGIYDPVL